ncbi:hypothetical protein L208DRAFT_892034 [Tricholoma matsutake]|nr:hypothetical protein L208DRAFT_892034 [Tricholoma matsutake 945]
MISVMEEASLNLNSSFSRLVEFPASFSASSKFNSAAPPMCLWRNSKIWQNIWKKSSRFERHVQSVSLAQAKREERRAEILHEMECTWRLVSPQFHYHWIPCNLLVLSFVPMVLDFFRRTPVTGGRSHLLISLVSDWLH